MSVGDTFTRIREAIKGHGGFQVVADHPELIRQIATENHVTVTAVRQTLTQMNQEHRHAHKVRDQFRKKLPPEYKARLRWMKIHMLEAGEKHLCQETLRWPEGVRIKMNGRELDYHEDNPDALTLEVYLPGEKNPAGHLNLANLIVLAMLAHLE